VLIIDFLNDLLLRFFRQAQRLIMSGGEENLISNLKVLAKEGSEYISAQISEKVMVNQMELDEKYNVSKFWKRYSRLEENDQKKYLQSYLDSNEIKYSPEILDRELTKDKLVNIILNSK
jgi:hypothetical protein